MTSTTFIYVLKDPVSNEIRYVGKSNNPKERYKSHKNPAHKITTHTHNWIMMLRSKGLDPVIEIIREVPISEWKYWEKHYIKHYNNLGCDLTNHCGGGEGLNFGNQTSFKKGQKSWNEGTRMKKFCAVCGKEFEVSPTGDKRYKCCSMRCSAVYRSKNPNKGTFKKGLVSPNKNRKGDLLLRNGSNSKSVKQLDRLTMKIIQIFPSAAEAERQTGINQGNITNNTCGRSKTAGGYVWEKL
jgi:predicted GIY-YIG superfamily endonuclease